MNKKLFGLITLRLNIHGYNRYARLKFKKDYIVLMAKNTLELPSAYSVSHLLSLQL